MPVSSFSGRKCISMFTCPLCRTIIKTSPKTIGQMRYFSCTQCRLIFLDPSQRLSNARERERYEKHENSIHDQGYRRSLQGLVTEMLQRLPLRAKGLDFGCGPGPVLSIMFQEENHRVFEYDPFFAPDAKLLDQTYDFITCSETLEHIFHPEKEMNLLHSLLRPNGWLGVQTKMFEDWEEFAQSSYRRDPTHVCFYNRSTFLWMARKMSWKVDFPGNHLVLMQKM